MPSPSQYPPAAERARAMRDALNAEFDVERVELALGGRALRIHHPRSAEALIDEDAFDRDERLPYWADIWPSARALAERVLALRGDGLTLLELGCGSGLVTVAAALAGFAVTASDYYVDALRFTELNVLDNAGVEIATRELDWRRFPRDLGRFDVVVASDVLYERPYAELIAGALDRTMTARGVGLIADPGRIAAPDFVARCGERGLRAPVVERVRFAEGEIRQTIDLYEVRRR